ncbi:MAG TPA: nucleotide sugar dehydrogenase [Candidatus Thermoplasmatota archaeon]|nr:nucleotide sugar dehydrogenase [Candidatus Thermoplasmatota archaeon]
MEDRRVVVIGLGYVGIPVAAKLADVGYDVTGLDLDRAKVDAVNAGRYPIQGNEPGLPELLARVVAAGRLRATTDPEAIAQADVVFVNVQTPFDVEAFEPRYTHLAAALGDVGKRLRKGMLVIVESTIAPTTMDRLARPTLEKASGLVAGRDFDLVHCPERVMPGKLLKNLTTLARVVGGVTPAAAERASRIYRRIVSADLDTTDMLTAELVKTAENTYRDVQIAFANELARIAETLGADAWRVRELVNKVPERHVHLPGLGVGGHCIPKDPWLLAHGTKGRYTPELIVRARAVNEAAPQAAAALVERALVRAGGSVAGSRVAILGASYLPDSDDTRHAPTLPLARALAAKGATVAIHDPFAKRLEEFPVEADLETVVKDADVIVLATAHAAYRALDWGRLAKLARTRVLVDGRNTVSAEAARKAGFAVSAVGRGLEGGSA